MIQELLEGLRTKQGIDKLWATPEIIAWTLCP